MKHIVEINKPAPGSPGQPTGPIKRRRGGDSIRCMESLALFSAALCVLLSCSFAPGAVDRPVSLPPAPPLWISELGQPQWLIRWYGPDGLERSLWAASGDEPLLDLPDSVPVPVLAYPCWPGRGIGPGIVRPAGAVFPFDAGDDRVELAWRGGPAANFFRELLLAGGPSDRRPERFDWPRFRSLLESDAVDAAVREDPWTVDWRTVAIRTRVSGFDSRRLRPRDAEIFRYPSPGNGPWLRSSPFAVREVAAVGGVLVLVASAEPDSLISASGVFRYSRTASAWFPARAPDAGVSLDKGDAMGYTQPDSQAGRAPRSPPRSEAVKEFVD
jgi:hypothetical protein